MKIVGVGEFAARILINERHVVSRTKHSGIELFGASGSGWMGLHSECVLRHWNHIGDHRDVPPWSLEGLSGIESSIQLGLFRRDGSRRIRRGHRGLALNLLKDFFFKNGA
jgi:hypothetical protein